MPKPALILVGGFLGSGKTTLILKAAGLLSKRGLRTAVITNDQDTGLVDTRLAEAQQVEAREVAGGCFCCRFTDLIKAAAQLRAYAPDVIFAEPVGSCVDLSATILQPLKAHYSEEYRTSPLTVLMDPHVARRVLSGQSDPDTTYLFQKQIAEADILCLTKSDLPHEDFALPFPVDFRLSARGGQGLEEWLDEVLTSSRPVGARLLDVDYTRYAEAEAALGWLNVRAQVELRQAASPSMVAGPLLDRLDADLTREGCAIAHLKMIDETAVDYVKAALCENGAEPVVEGNLLGEAARQHSLIINLRAIADPLRLRKTVELALAALDGTVHIRHLSAFRPAPPKPEHRFAEAVR